MTVMDRWTGDELFRTVTRAAPYETLTRDVFDGVLGMLAGAYPSDEFAELKPRVVWDRVTDTIEGRRDARVVAVTSGGTIPDRGLFGVFMAGEAGTPGRRVGELDEEMVYELRAGMHGDVIVLGASSWRIDEIGHDRVTVSPAPGVPGKLPFWKGDAVGRPIELGRAMGAFIGEMERDLSRGAAGRDAATQRLREFHDLDAWAAENLVAYLEDEREATGALPTDKRVVVERFKDELGDWRLTLLTPVRRPRPRAVVAGARGAAPGAARDGGPDHLVGRRHRDPPARGRDEPRRRRGAALPRRRRGRGPGRRAGRATRRCSRAGSARTRRGPCSCRAADPARARRCGSSASEPPTCWPWPAATAASRSSSRRTASACRDVFDLDALREILAGVARREIVVHGVETPRASPFASSLLFDYVAAYMYDGDAPLAERRAGALTLDRDLLRELLGQEELRELLDPDALADLELSLQALADDRQASTLDGVHDLLRRLGDLTADEVAARTVGGAVVAEPWLAELASSRRAVRTRIAGEDRWIAIEDVARYRDGVGITPPVGVPQAFLGPAAGALDGLLARWARTHGPFLTPEPARRWGLPVGVVDDALERLLRAGSLLRGEFRPGGSEREWCDPDVLRLLRRRSLARLRREVEPVDPVALGRFLPAWHGVDPVLGPGSDSTPFRGSAALERLAEVVDQLAGVAIPASVLERDVLPARIPGYQPRLLDELGAMGEVAWVGRGSLGRDDGRIALLPTRPRGAPPGRPAGRHDPPRRRAARPDPRASERPWRELLSRAGGVGQASLGPRAARRAVGPRLGRRGHQRHVRTAPGAALEAPDGQRLQRRAPTAGRPPDRARAAGGRRPLVARPARRPVTATERLHAQALAMLERHGVLTREAVASESLEGGFSARLPDPPGARGRRPDPARLLRRRPRRGPVRARRRPRPAARRPRAGAEHDRTTGPPARGRRPGQPVRRRAAVAASRRGRPTAVPARGRRVRGPRRWRRGALPRARRVARSRRCRPPTIRTPWSPPSTAWRGSSTTGRARELVIRKVDGAPVGGVTGPPATPRRRLRRRLPRPDAPRVALMPEGDTLFRTAAGLRPYLVGRERGARPRPGTRRGAPGGSARRPARRRGRVAGQEPARSASTAAWSSGPICA